MPIYFAIQSKQKMDLLSCPEEIIELIINSCDKSSKSLLILVCKKLKRICPKPLKYGYLTTQTAKDNHLELLQWLYQKKFPIREESILIMASLNKNLEMMKFVAFTHGDRSDFDGFQACLLDTFGANVECTFSKIMTIACKNGDIPIIDYLHKEMRWLFLSETSLDTIVAAGHLTLIEYLFAANLIKKDCRLRQIAARMGHLGIYKLAVENGHKLNARVLDNAIKHSNFNVIDYCREKKCRQSQFAKKYFESIPKCDNDSK